MKFQPGVGMRSLLQNPMDAARDAAEEAKKNAGGLARFGIILASSKYDQQKIAHDVHVALGGAPTIGCSAAGIITNAGVQEDAVAVLAFGGDAGSFYPVRVDGISKDMRQAGQTFARKLKEAGRGGEMKGALMFSDALSGNGTELIRGVLSEMGETFMLAGGAAGDDMQFKKTFQYFNGEAINDAAVGVGVAGDIVFSSAAGHGWRPIGAPHTVSKANGTTLMEIDGRPAFSLYQEYFDEKADDFKQALTLSAVTYPLGMKTGGSEEWMIRVPLAVNQDGSIVCGAEVIEGSEIRLMIGTIDTSLEAAERAAKTVVAILPSTGEKSVMFISDCVARKILFGHKKEQEIDLLRSIAGPTVELFGFYSYGQIAPLPQPPKDINTCDPGFYEQSISLTVLAERQ